MLQQPALVEAEDEPHAAAEDVGVVMLQQPAAVEAEDEPQATRRGGGRGGSGGGRGDGGKGTPLASSRYG